MINKEDKADVKRVMGGKVASKVATATNDSKSKALKKAKRISDPYGTAKISRMLRSDENRIAVAKGKAEYLENRRHINYD